MLFCGGISVLSALSSVFQRKMEGGRVERFVEHWMFRHVADSNETPYPEVYFSFCNYLLYVLHHIDKGYTRGLIAYFQGISDFLV